MSLTTNAPPAVVPANPLLPRDMGEAMKLADMMSKARLLPQAVQNPADAFLVINQAMRWGMDPFAVAQEVSVIQGKLMHSGKIVAAAIQSSGVLDGRLHYDYAGDGEARQVTVRALLRGETEAREVVVKLRDARTQNKVWTTQPDQQLAYHGARVWARRYAPEVMLGVYAPEEMDDAPSAPPMPPARGPVVDMQPAPALVMLDPRGQERSAPDAATWQRWCMAAVGKLEDAPAVLAWLRAMEDHFDAAPGDAVQAVRDAANARADELDAAAGA